MRHDMANLLVERGHASKAWSQDRPKGWAAQCRFRHDEDEPLESWRPPIRRPSFSENLNPLRRFLAKQVGRRWDTVYSEIRAQVDADNAVQYHILQHLYDDLAVDVRERDGELWHHGRGGPELLTGSGPRWWRWRPTLYVCPRSGLIKRVKRRTHRETPPPQECLPGSEANQDYRRIAGQWYEVWWAREPQTGNLIVDHKRQLSWKELRRLGLRD